MELYLLSPMELHNAVISFTFMFVTLIQTAVRHWLLDFILLRILGIVNSLLSQEEGKIRQVFEVFLNRRWKVMQ
jgi:hypothetical protein